MAVFTNQAVLTYGTTQVFSNVTTGQILESLTVSKTALQASYTAGEKITYVVTLVNSGAAALTGLTLTDDLGAYAGGGGTLYPLTYEDNSLLVLENGVVLSDVTVLSEQPLTVTGIDVPANGGTTVIYAAQVNGFAPLAAGGSITNTVQLTGTQLAQPVTAECTINVTEGPQLTVEKSLEPLAVAPGQTITYTMTVNNYGNAEAGAEVNAVLTDKVTPVLTGLAVTYNSDPWTGGTEYTYSEQSGMFTTSSGAITVPAAQFTTAADGSVTVTPGTAVIVLQGTVG